MKLLEIYNWGASASAELQENRIIYNLNKVCIQFKNRIMYNLNRENSQNIADYTNAPNEKIKRKNMIFADKILWESYYQNCNQRQRIFSI